MNTVHKGFTEEDRGGDRGDCYSVMEFLFRE